MARPQRREHQVNLIREAILDAALRVFASRGYQAATMNEIATEAGYTAPSLYNYFKGKEQIFEAIHGRLHDEFLAAFDEPVPSGLGFRQRLELLIHRHLRLADDRREAFSVFMSLGGPGTENPCANQASGIQVFLERLTRWIKESATPAELGGHAPEEVAYFLWGVGNAFHVRWMLSGADAKLSDQATTILDLFLHGVSGAAKPVSRGGRS